MCAGLTLVTVLDLYFAAGLGEELCWAKSGGALQSVVKYIVRNGGRKGEIWQQESQPTGC